MQYKKKSRIQDRREYGEELPKFVSMVKMANIHGDDIDAGLIEILTKKAIKCWKRYRKHQYRRHSK